MAAVEYTRSFGGKVPQEVVLFSMDAEQDQAASLSAGRPIFRNVEKIEIHFPGNPLTVINRKVKEEDRQRWPVHYKAFKEQGKQIIEGTPLSAWPALNAAQIKEFNFLDIMTVEQLANLNDLAIQRVGMGARMWKDRAKAFLEAANDFASVDKLAAKNVQLEETVTAQQRQLAELGALTQQLQSQMQALQGVALARNAAGAPSVAQPPMLGTYEPLATPATAATEEKPYIEPKRRGRPPKIKAEEQTATLGDMSAI